MRLAIIEPHYRTGGHHCVHLRHILTEACSRGWSVLLGTCKGYGQHPALADLPPARRDLVTVQHMPHVPFPERPTSLALMRYQFALYRTFSTFYRRHLTAYVPDVIYLVNLDYCDKLMAITGSPFGGYPFMGMLMSARFHHWRAGIANKWRMRDPLCGRAFRRLLGIGTLRAVLCIDETLVQFGQDQHIPGAEKLQYVPDIGSLEVIGDRSEGRRRLGIQDDEFVVLVYGRLSARKGVAQLLKAIATSACPSRAKVLLAGDPDSDTARLLDSSETESLRRGGRLITMLHPIDGKTEEGRLFGAADAVWLGYVGHEGMSGVLVQAARAGRPVIACREGLIGWFTRRHEIGAVVNALDPLDVAVCIETLMVNGAVRQKYAAAGELIAAAHTQSAFSRRVCDAIRSGAGLSTGRSVPL